MADKTYQSEPGVYIYDTFQYPENKEMFMTAIFAEIDPLQYWRDRPLLLKRPLPITAQAVNLNPKNLAEATENPTVIDSVKEAAEMYPVMFEQHRAVEEIKEEMQGIVIPLPRVTNSGAILIVDEMEDPEPGSGPNISILDDEVVLDRLGTARRAATRDGFDDAMELQEDIIDTFDPVIINIDEVYDAIEPQYLVENMPGREQIAEESWRPMGEPSDQWYGIPLVNVGPRDIPTADSFLLEVNAKNDWNVCVTNVVTTGLHKDTLIIDRQIPPGKKFMVGVYTIYNKVGIILRIQGDPKIYQKEIVTTMSEIPEVISYGVDTQFIKSLSGHVWDALFWKQASNFNHNVPAPEPEYPEDGWIYDFRKTGVNSTSVGGTIDGNTIRSIYDYGPTARVGSGSTGVDGRFLQLTPSNHNIATGFPGIHPWYFIYESYLDNFFCRTHLQQDSFTILWYQWLFHYPTGKHNFISDSIFSNYLTYDYDRFQMVFEFNGRKYTESITLPEQMWAQMSLRYNKNTGDLSFALCDNICKVQEKIVFNIGTDLEFELISLFGRYNKEEHEYQNIHRGLMGMVMIHEEYKSDKHLRDLNHEIGIYLNQYTPSDDQLLTI